MAAMNNVQTLLKQTLDNDGNAEAVGQAAAHHVESLPPDQVQSHVQSAVNHAEENGDADAAHTLRNVLTRGSGGDIKSALISYVTSHPQILEHFEPEFARNILGRL